MHIKRLPEDFVLHVVYYPLVVVCVILMLLVTLLLDLLQISL